MARKTRVKGHSASRIGSGGGSVKSSGIPSVNRIAWFDAASINPTTHNGTAIATLANLSETEPDAAQATVSFQPVYMSAGGPDSGPALIFDGTGDTLAADYGGANVSTDQVTVAGVWTRASNIPNSTLAALSDGDPRGNTASAGYKWFQAEWRQNAINKSFMWSGDGTTSQNSISAEADATTDWRCDVATRDDTAYTWIKDGVALTMSTGGSDAAANAQYLYLGATFNSNLAGYIRTLCMWSRVLTAEERARVDVRLRGIGGV